VKLNSKLLDLVRCGLLDPHPYLDDVINEEESEYLISLFNAIRSGAYALIQYYLEGGIDESFLSEISFADDLVAEYRQIRNALSKRLNSESSRLSEKVCNYREIVSEFLRLLDSCFLAYYLLWDKIHVNDYTTVLMITSNTMMLSCRGLFRRSNDRSEITNVHSSIRLVTPSYYHYLSHRILYSISEFFIYNLKLEYFCSNTILGTIAFLTEPDKSFLRRISELHKFYTLTAELSPTITYDDNVYMKIRRTFRTLLRTEDPSAKVKLMNEFLELFSDFACNFPITLSFWSDVFSQFRSELSRWNITEATVEVSPDVWLKFYKNSVKISWRGYGYNRMYDTLYTNISVKFDFRPLYHFIKLFASSGKNKMEKSNSSPASFLEKLVRFYYGEFT